MYTHESIVTCKALRLREYGGMVDLLMNQSRYFCENLFICQNNKVQVTIINKVNETSTNLPNKHNNNDLCT